METVINETTSYRGFEASHLLLMERNDRGVCFVSSNVGVHSAACDKNTRVVIAKLEAVLGGGLCRKNVVDRGEARKRGVQV